MRATDDRYRGEQAKFELAMRMIGHEARTGTIRYFTGLNDDRIRKLYTTYFKYQRGARAPAARSLADAHRAARADAAAGTRVRRVREPAARERPALDRAAAGPAAKAQRRSRPSFLRVLRDVRRARAAQLAVVRVGLEPAGQHAARRRARHRALRRVLDLLRLRRLVAAALGVPGVPRCSSSAASSTRSPRPGSMAGCASSSSPSARLRAIRCSSPRIATSSTRGPTRSRRGGPSRRACSAGAIS